MKRQRISFKALIVSLLILITVFLPNSFDLALLLTVGGVHVRFFNLLALMVAIVLLIRCARTRQVHVPGRIRGFSLAVALMIGGIIASEAYIMIVEGANIRPFIQDTLPVATPIVLAWVLHLDGWRQRDIQWMIRLYMICALLTVGIDILLIINYTPLYALFGWKMGRSLYSSRPNQAIGTAIAIAGLLSITLPLSLLLQKSGRGIWKIAYFLCPWILLLGIALQASRLAAGVVLLFLFLTTAAAKKGRGLRLAALAALFIVIFVGYIFVGFFFERYTVLRNASSITRAQSGIVGLRIFVDHFTFGTGIGGFYPRAQQTIAASATVDVRGLGEKIMVYKDWGTLPDPHDLYIMWLAETGLAGTLGLLTCIWAFARYGKRVLKAAKQAGVSDASFRAAGWGVVLIVAQMFGASFLLNNNRMAILIWVYIALTLEVGRRTLAASRARRMAVTQAQRQQQPQGDRQYVA